MAKEEVKKPAAAKLVRMLSMREGEVILSRDEAGKPKDVFKHQEVKEVSEETATWLEQSFKGLHGPHFKRV